MAASQESGTITCWQFFRPLQPLGMLEILFRKFWCFRQVLEFHLGLEVQALTLGAIGSSSVAEEDLNCDFCFACAM